MTSQIGTSLAVTHARSHAMVVALATPSITTIGSAATGEEDQSVTEPAGSRRKILTSIVIVNVLVWIVLIAGARWMFF